MDERRAFALAAVLLLAAAGAALVVNMLSRAPPTDNKGVPRKNPADMLLTRADLPQGGIMTDENVVNLPVLSSAWRTFLLGSVTIKSSATVWDSAEGAIKQYEDFKRSCWGQGVYYYEPAPDDNYSWFVIRSPSLLPDQVSAVVYVSGACRKENTVLTLLGSTTTGGDPFSAASVLDYITPAEFAGCLQKMADRAGNAGIPSILPPEVPPAEPSPQPQTAGGWYLYTNSVGITSGRKSGIAAVYFAKLGQDYSDNWSAAGAGRYYIKTTGMGRGWEGDITMGDGQPFAIMVEAVGNEEDMASATADNIRVNMWIKIFSSPSEYALVEGPPDSVFVFKSGGGEIGINAVWNNNGAGFIVGSGFSYPYPELWLWQQPRTHS